MSSRLLLPRVNEEGSAAAAGAKPTPPVGAHQMHRTSTMLRQLNAGGSRRRSFLLDLQEQMQKHKEEDAERERQREILAIHRILQRPPENRDTADIDTLYDWVMRNGSTNKIFQGAQEIICKTICREMTLLELPAKGAVCYQGDYGDIFFIIIQGSVSLYVETKKKLAPPASTDGAGANGGTSNNQRDETKPHERFRQQRAMTGLGDSAKSELTPEELYGAFIKQIGAGGTFGELAVMDPTARRSCTILCDGPTSFICLKRAAYQRLIRITNSSQLDFTQVEFLETLYFFEKWPHGELMRLSNRLRHMTFPADSHLARIATEANLIFFIYSGIVQETIPLVHHLNDNGNVVKCATLDTDSALRITLQELTLADRKVQQQRRRVALEVNMYQEHDICGEFPIVFNKPTSNTDLLAVTDVKVLIMDRETWRDVFFMHGLEHVRESHRRFRLLAQARENWRQTRLKLELANPGLHITLSTKAMMQDGKCMCGWCGSHDHITGDASCPSLVASKQRQADKQKKREADKSSPSGRRARTPNGSSGDPINTRANAVKNTLTFVNQLQEHAAHRKASAIAMGLSVPDIFTLGGGASRPTTPRTPSGLGRGGTPRQQALRHAAQRIMSENQQKWQDVGFERPASQPPITIVDDSPRKQAVIATNSSANLLRTRVTNDLYEVLKAAQDDAASAEPTVVPPKLEEVRKGAFTEALSQQYRQELVRKAKRITKVQQFYDTREQLLEQIQSADAALPEERRQRKLPRKPKIPKPNRRLAMCSKSREPRPDRFNRKINRVLKKMWAQDHPIPVVEESLRDS